MLPWQRTRLNLNIQRYLTCGDICWRCAQRQARRHNYTIQSAGPARERDSLKPYDTPYQLELRRRQKEEGRPRGSRTSRHYEVKYLYDGWPKPGLENLRDQDRKETIPQIRRKEYVPSKTWIRRWIAKPAALVRRDFVVEETRKGRYIRLGRRRLVISKPVPSLDAALAAFGDLLDRKTRDSPKPVQVSHRPTASTRLVRGVRCYSTSSVGERAAVNNSRLN